MNRNIQYQGRAPVRCYGYSTEELVREALSLLAVLAVGLVTYFVWAFVF